MGTPAEHCPADGITLGELRVELRRLVALADTAELPKPDRAIPDKHPMGPGVEWRVKDRADLVYDPNRLWSILTREPDDVADCIYIHTPDSMTGDYISCSTAEARELAMALLAACHRADQNALGVRRLEERRARRPRVRDGKTSGGDGPTGGAA